MTPPSVPDPADRFDALRAVPGRDQPERRGPDTAPARATRRARAWLADRLPVTVRAGRWVPDPRAVLALALVAALAVGAGAGLLWRGRGTTVERLPAPGPGATAGPDWVPAAGPTPVAAVPTPVPGAEAIPSATASGPEPVLVHVVGRVREPGVVHLGPGDRVLDALQAAGGPTRAADLAGLNLARPVQDGEQVYVPRRGESASTGSGGPAGPAGYGSPPGAAGAAGAAGAPPEPAAPGAALPGAPVDLNAADAAALEDLPGIGPVLAGRIVEWRAANGGFRAVEDLLEVTGIGPARLAELAGLVTV